MLLEVHDNIHVRGYQEEGTITTPFDMTVLNELDRFHLVLSALARLPDLDKAATQLQAQLKEKLSAHRRYICEHGEDMPEVRDWHWPGQSRPLAVSV